MIITTTHFRKANYCVRLSREFCKRHGLDWDKFIRQGLPEEELIATGDHMAIRLVEIAHGD